MKTKFHPTLFSTPMVQAILEDRKTQTRRTKGLEEINKNPSDWKFDRHAVDMAFKKIGIIFSNDNEEMHIPFKANIGDALWVRETFEMVPVQKASVFGTDDLIKEKVNYKADGTECFKNWKPSIFMPKPACRIFLKIKSIRVERLQQISENDAIAEGAKDTLTFSELDCMKDLGKWIIPRPFSQHQFGFLSIWCNINGPENWLSNPFVWVYEFEKIEKPNDFIV